MTRAAIWLLAAGVCLFIGVLVSQESRQCSRPWRFAGWGLIAVALFHLLPLVLRCCCDSRIARPRHAARPDGSMHCGTLGRRVRQQPDARWPDRRATAE